LGNYYISNPEFYDFKIKCDEKANDEREEEEKTLTCLYIPCLVWCSSTDAEKQLQKEQGIFME